MMEGGDGRRKREEGGRKEEEEKWKGGGEGMGGEEGRRRVERKCIICERLVTGSIKARACQLVTQREEGM